VLLGSSTYERSLQHHSVFPSSASGLRSAEANRDLQKLNFGGGTLMSLQQGSGTARAAGRSTGPSMNPQ
jgi:hypothetical protein